MRLLSLSCLALIVGCSSSSFDASNPEDTGTDTLAETATEVGADADTGAPDTAVTDADAGPCDDTRAPKDAPCVLRDDLGVFVSSSLGDDANDGTKIKPFKTLAKALGTAKDKKKRLYACAEEFGEAVVAVDGVAAFGGVDCKSGWVGVTGQTTAKAPTSPAFTAKNLTEGAQFTNFSFVAPDATGVSGSSVGGFAANSKLSFDLCAFTAGSATNGANGDPGVNGAKGNPGVAGENARTIAACPDRPAGGAGGIAFSAGGDGGSTCGTTGQGKTAAVSKAGVCGLGSLFDGGTGVCGVLVSGSGFLTGLEKGCPATDGANGTAGKSLGAVTADGLASAPNGTDGTAGSEGGGGGGGGAGLTVSSSGAGGGGGGGGGKGGGGGRGGKSGGSSVAFVSFNSTVTLARTDLKAADAGKGGGGGDGAFGGTGGKGEDGGTPKTSSNERGCRGGDGASGGNGGAGAGGGGGGSIGVLFVGTKPTRTAGTIKLGAAGTGGIGGAGAATKAPNGEGGVAVEEKGL